ncbi:MAG: selenide, water dikinase SelD [Acidobacteriota bacterium]
MGPADLQAVLAGLKGMSLPAGYSGFKDAEDVGVVPLDAENDLLFTADFFTPIVDDPYAFGAIAAANALGDIYAKGGTPLASLNLAAFPAEIGPEVMSEILRGGAEKAAEGGAPVVGGHTIKDREIKFGLAVIGKVRKGEFLSLGGAQAGDDLVLTKPVGTGILATGLKRGLLDQPLIDTITALMTQLNGDASRIACDHGATAATDVTGYGLLGHLGNMVRASGIETTVYFSKVPVLEGALNLARAGHVPGGGKANLQYAEAFTTFVDNIDESERLILADPQTSGGLLLAVPASQTGCLLAKLEEAGYSAAAIGTVGAASAEGLIVVRR